MLDGDPQGDTSKTFGVFEPDGIGMSELLEKHECVGGTYKTGDLIRPTEYSHVDIIPANGYLMKTDMNLLLKSEDNQVTRLREALEEVADAWIEKGLVTVTETLGGIKTDYKYIIKYLEDLVKEYDLKPQLICYDPHNASAFLSDLAVMENGEKVQCYGYYNDCNGVKWLYVVYKNIVGYASSKYLSK